MKINVSGLKYRSGLPLNQRYRVKSPAFCPPVLLMDEWLAVLKWRIGKSTTPKEAQA
jgi:hypothetical protein